MGNQNDCPAPDHSKCPGCSISTNSTNTDYTMGICFTVPGHYGRAVCNLCRINIANNRPITTDHVYCASCRILMDDMNTDYSGSPPTYTTDPRYPDRGVCNKCRKPRITFPSAATTEIVPTAITLPSAANTAIVPTAPSAPQEKC